MLLNLEGFLLNPVFIYRSGSIRNKQILKRLPKNYYFKLCKFIVIRKSLSISTLFQGDKND